MQGTRRRDPPLADRRPPPRTEPDPCQQRTIETRRGENTEAASPATEELDVKSELADLVLLFSFILGAVALANALLHS